MSLPYDSEYTGASNLMHAYAMASLIPLCCCGLEFTPKRKHFVPKLYQTYLSSIIFPNLSRSTKRAQVVRKSQRNTSSCDAKKGDEVLDCVQRKRETILVLLLETSERGIDFTPSSTIHLAFSPIRSVSGR